MPFRLCISLLLLLQSAHGAVVVIRDVTVINPGEPPLPHQTVILGGDRIDRTGPAASTPAPPGARVVDGRGKYLIPGLWDMHVHLWHPANPLSAYLAHGVTGIRDMGSDLSRVNKWRTAPQPLPHIITSGPPVAGKDSGDEKLPVIVVRTPEEARAAVDRIEESGADFVKVLSDVPREAYIALAERARQLEIDFAGHLPTAISPWEAVEARQNSIEHMFGLTRAFAVDADHPIQSFSPERAREFFERSARFGTWHVPTLTLWRRMASEDVVTRVRDPRLNEVPASIRKSWPRPEEEIAAADSSDARELRAQLRLIQGMIPILRDSGAGILAGTDTGDPYTIPGVTLQEELAMLVDAGLTPAEALAAATSNPAKFLGWDDKSGAVREGFLADLVLLDADPLADIRNVAKVAGVAVQGRYLNRAALARMLAAASK